MKTALRAALRLATVSFSATVSVLATFSVGAALVLVPAAPALARIRDDGADPGQGLSALETFLIFVVAPVGAFLLIALLVMAPSIARGPRYRTGRRWDAQPQVFGVREEIAVTEADEPAEEGGGTSARW